MTWEHLQQLRAAATAEIERRIAALQPHGGHGVTVDGDTIALKTSEDAQAEPSISYAIWQQSNIDYRINFDGQLQTGTHSWGEEIVVQVYPSVLWYWRPTTVWQHIQLANISGDNGFSLVRKGRVRFSMKPFYFPVKLLLEQQDEAGNVYSSSWLEMPQGYADINVEAAKPEVFLYLHVVAAVAM